MRWLYGITDAMDTTLGDGEGRGGLGAAVYGVAESDTTGQLNSNNDTLCHKRLAMSFITQ